MANDDRKITELANHAGGFAQAAIDRAMIPLAKESGGNTRIGVDEIVKYTNNAIQSALDGFAELEDIEEINKRITAIENLGDYAGSFNTYALLPKNTSGFTIPVTVNDFATIRTPASGDLGNPPVGSPARYIIKNISASGEITWEYDISYSTDVSGKADNTGSVSAGSGSTTTTPAQNNVGIWSFLQTIWDRIYALATGKASTGSATASSGYYIRGITLNSSGNPTITQSALPSVDTSGKADNVGSVSAGSGSVTTTPAQDNVTLWSFLQTIWNRIYALRIAVNNIANIFTGAASQILLGNGSLTLSPIVADSAGNVIHNASEVLPTNRTLGLYDRYYQVYSTPLTNNSLDLTSAGSIAIAKQLPIGTIIIIRSVEADSVTNAIVFRCYTLGGGISSYSPFTGFRKFTLLGIDNSGRAIWVALCGH